MIADFIKFCDGWDSTKKTFFFWKAEEFSLHLLLGGNGGRTFRKIKKLFLLKWPFYMISWGMKIL
jgi:hypothetical protein